ncbi:copper amine oxidase N-terminal domain-containing protein [Paenibacillus abyssi]|uniref:Copper amine oxidase-like N-terminal domain-containing protein n=1 Tax=Paenibacillus abyssi TaxID=1340531 RepID=A0A917FP13_9BACL|nr:stalk domain-containing protein [Paenibacillus abyssi]GGF96800.1 hypothetical protein GCM10010916_12540 [Paenibacillus abyssi]
MKKSMGKKSLLALLLAAVLVIAVGCQAVGGVDFNQMLKQSLKVTSMEGKQSIELQLLLKDGAAEGMPEEEVALMNMLSNMKLEFNDIKMKDAQNMSLNGQLWLGESNIGFSLQMSEQLAVLKIEGSDRAFEMDMTDASLGGILPMAEEPAPSVDAETQAELTEIGRQIIDHVGGYVIDNLPNPSKLSVNPVQETINGESLSVFHVQAEINGEELVGWLHSYLDALIADREGLSAMLTGLFESLSKESAIWESLGTSNPFAEADPGGQTKEEFIEENVEIILTLLDDVKMELTALEQEEAESLGIILNKDTYMKADLYVDSKLDIRKSVLEAVIKPSMTVQDDEEMLAEIPFEGILIRSTSEMWNVNGNVSPVQPVQTANAVTLDELMEKQSYEVVRLFNSDSVVYNLLKDMGMTKQTVMMHPVYEVNPPIITPDGITLIPLRDTLNQLGATLSYDASSKKYTILDKGTNTKIVLSRGSKKVTINNEQKTWSFPAANIGGTLYVPARDFITSVGGTIKWDTFYMDEKILLLEREL